MKGLVNRVSFLGLGLLIAPLVIVALQGPVGKPTAFKAMLISLSGLALAAVGAWCHFLLKRLERLKEERRRGQSVPECFDVTKESSFHSSF
jgi:hypothetical protein